MAVSVSADILNLPGQLKQNIYNIHEVNSMVLSNADQHEQKQTSNDTGRNSNGTQSKRFGISSQKSDDVIHKISKDNICDYQGERKSAKNESQTDKNNISEIYKRVQQNLKHMAIQHGLDAEVQEQALSQLRETIKNHYLNANYNQVNLHFCQQDVYSGKIRIGDFLQLFIYRYDFSMPFNEYIGYFKSLNDVFQQISKITKQINNQSKIFNSKTLEGQKRMQQIKTANVFNQQVYESFLQLMKCCSGAEYIPDVYFKVKYKKLPEQVQKLINAQLLSTDKQKILYQIIACGTNDMKLTYNENYAQVVEQLEKQLDRTQIWTPYTLYLQIIKANKKGPQNQTIVYNRCDYEIHLINQLEKVMLYFIMRLILARKQYGILSITTNELITIYQKISSMVSQITTMEELKDDDLWLEVEDYVNWRAQQQLTEMSADFVFKYDRFGIRYETGEIFEQSKEDAAKQLESIKQKRQKQAEEAEAERRRREEEIERLIRQK